MKKSKVTKKVAKKPGRKTEKQKRLEILFSIAEYLLSQLRVVKGEIRATMKDKA